MKTTKTLLEQEILDIDFDISIDDSTLCFEYKGKGYYYNLIVDQQMAISYHSDYCRHNGEMVSISENPIIYLEIYDLIECWDKSTNKTLEALHYLSDDFIVLVNERINEIVMFMTTENSGIESIKITDNPDCGVKGITFKSE